LVTAFACCTVGAFAEEYANVNSPAGEPFELSARPLVRPGFVPVFVVVVASGELFASRSM
jgi:hypothetical protein